MIKHQASISSTYWYSYCHFTTDTPHSKSMKTAVKEKQRQEIHQNVFSTKYGSHDAEWWDSRFDFFTQAVFGSLF